MNPELPHTHCSSGLTPGACRPRLDERRFAKLMALTEVPERFRERNRLALAAAKRNEAMDGESWIARLIPAFLKASA